jgi:hypothetical protein
MTIPINNISIQDISNEFGWPTYPKNISAYYAGGGLVSNPAPTSASQTGIIPVSGPISIGNFRGVTKFTPITITPPAKTDMYGHTNGSFDYQASRTYNATNIHFILTASGGRPSQDSSAVYSWSLDVLDSGHWESGIVQPQQFASQGSELVIPQNTANNSIMDFYARGDGGGIKRYVINVSDGISTASLQIGVGFYW